METIVSLHEDTKVEETMPKGRRLEKTPPPQQKKRRRGRTQKNKEAGEHQNLVESCGRSTTEESLMCAIRLELVETASQGSGSRTRRMET
jgi:hypothetical protein